MASTPTSQRRKHISRLPSSALLGQNICEHLASQVRLITVHLREGAGPQFVKEWVAASSQTDDKASSVSWELFQITSNSCALLLVAREQQQSTAPPRRQLSGMLNHDNTMEPVLARWLGSAQGSLDKPYDSQKCLVLLSSRAGQSGDAPTLTTVVLESIKVKSGQEREFSEFCVAWLTANKSYDDEQPALQSCTKQDTETAPSTPASREFSMLGKFGDAIYEELGLHLACTVLQDVTDSTLFKLIYFFNSPSDMHNIRGSQSWKRWRSRFGAFTAGSPVVHSLRLVLHDKQEHEEKVLAQIAPEHVMELDGVHDPTYLPSEVSARIAIKAAAYDPRLHVHADFISRRFEAYVELFRTIVAKWGSLGAFASGYDRYGVMPAAHEPGFLIREWLPGAKSVHVIGDFNNWDREATPLRRVQSEGVWEGTATTMKDDECFKILVTPESGVAFDKPSAWTKLARKSGITGLMDSVVYAPFRSFQFKHSRPTFAGGNLQIYETHVGAATGVSDRTGSFNEFTQMVLPRVKALGLNAVILQGVQEHCHFGSAGWHVTSFFAPASRFGTPDELKLLVDTAHGLGIKVILSMIISHAGPSPDGISWLDGTESAGGLLRTGQEGKDLNWDAQTFDFSTEIGQQFGASFLRYFLLEYNLDGFRLEGLSSLLYKDHGLNGGFNRHDCELYVTDNAHIENSAFCMILNEMLHTERPDIISIASDVTETPAMAVPINHGGLGFDYVMCHHLPVIFSRLIEMADSPNLSVANLVREVDRISADKRIAFTESLETCTVSKRPMKIAFFAWETLHTIAVGGIAPHVTELAAALRRIGHEVHVFTRAVGCFPTISVHYGVHYHEVTFNLNSNFVQECANLCAAFVSSMLEYEKSTGDTFSIVHGHDWLAARAVTALKSLGRVCVFTMHSTEVGRCGNRNYEGESASIRAIEREACMVADRVICVSGVLADEVKSLYGIPAGKIRVVYNGCNVQNFDGFEDAAPIKERYGINPLDPTFLFVGRFVIQKGVDLLIEAIPDILKMRGDVRFVIVGDGHMRKEVESRAAELRVSHATRFLGTKGGAELKSLFKMCDAVVIPSRNEPFGIVVLEAWSAFKPAIATTCGGPRDFVTPNVDGLLVDPVPSSIAWGCCELLKNFDHARWMGERGRVKAAYSFSWNTIGVQTRDIYYELFDKTDAPYGLSYRGDCSLAQRTIGAALYSHMLVSDNANWVRRGLTLLRVTQVLSNTLGGEALMYPMGSEFAHPDCIEYPRAGNGFNSCNAGRHWELSKDKHLRYKDMMLFNAVLLEVDRLLDLSNSEHVLVLKSNDDDKVLAYERGDCLIVVNLNAHKSFVDYGIGHSLSAGDLRLVVDTDEARFGGWGRLDAGGRFARYPRCEETFDDKPYSLKLYLPSRCALVLTTTEAFELRGPNMSTLISSTTSDEFVERLP